MGKGGGKGGANLSGAGPRLVNKRQATQPKSESFFEVGGAATSVLHLATDDAHPPPHCYDR
jgi:hypothetical protein